MQTKQVTFSIDLSDEDDQALNELLGAAPSFAEVLANHAKAALTEYIEAYLGRRTFAKGGDILELRLALLIEHAFGGQIPNEARVGSLLQTSPAGSRTLIRNALSKYRRQLDAATKRSAKSVLEAVTWSGDICHSTTAPANLIELLNQRLLAEDSTLKPVSRVPGSGGTYAFDQHSYDKLCVAFGATKVVKP